MTESNVSICDIVVCVAVNMLFIPMRMIWDSWGVVHATGQVNQVKSSQKCIISFEGEMYKYYSSFWGNLSHISNMTSSNDDLILVQYVTKSACAKPLL